MNKKYSLKHLSVRVPWHDNKWNGTICQNPLDNTSCLILRSCSLGKNDEKEEKNKGKSILDIPKEEIPPCIHERGTFMLDKPFDKYSTHPYSKKNKYTHGHLLETVIRFPPYSLACVPFLWLSKNNSPEKLAEKYDLKFDINREPKLTFKDNWIQEVNNQKALLNCFFEHIKVEESLCFIYAKQVPFVESSGRILIGVGRVKNINDGVEYNIGSDPKFRENVS